MKDLIHLWNQLKYYTAPDTFTKAQVLKIVEDALLAAGKKKVGVEWV